MNVSRNVIYKLNYRDGVLKYDIRIPFRLFFGALGFTTNIGMPINTILKFEHKKTGLYQRLVLCKYQHNLRRDDKLVIKVISLVFLPWDKGVLGLKEGLIDILKSSSEMQNVGLLPVKEEAKRMALDQLSKQHILKKADKGVRESLILTDYDTPSSSPNQMDFHNPAAMESLVN